MRPLGVALLATSFLAVAGAVAAESAPSAGTALDLRTAERLLVQHSPVVAAARVAAAAAAAERGRVDVAPNPVLQASVSNTRAGRYPYGSSDRMLRLEQLLERGNKRDLRTGLALELADAAHFEAADVLRQQLALLGAAHADLAAAQRLEALASDNLAGYERLVAAGAQRVAAGDLAAADQLRLEVEAVRAAADLRSARAAIAQAGTALAALIGLPDAGGALRADAGVAVLPLVDAMLARADQPGAFAAGLDARPDLLAADRRLVAAERAFSLAASLRVRDLTLGMQLERAPDLGGTVLGVSVGFPLFLNNDFSGELRRAQAEIDVVRTQRERIRRAALAEAEAARVRLEAAADRARRLGQEAVPRAQSVAAMVEAGFAQGGGTLNDLFDTRRQLAAVRAEAVQAQAEVERALAQWRAAVPTADAPGIPGAQPAGSPR